MNYPRRQQWIETGRAVAATLVGLAIAVVGLQAAAAMHPGAVLVAGALATVFFALGWRAWRRRGRYKVGADTEAQVRRVLRALGGWKVRHSVPHPLGGDVDHLAYTPGGQLAFVVETKTRSYTPQHLERTRTAAEYVRRRRRGPDACVAVLVVCRARNLERLEDGVVVCSVDQLLRCLREVFEAFQAAQRPADGQDASVLPGILSTNC